MKRRPLHYLLWIALGLAGCGLLLSACGQKGDLYLPEEAGQQEDQDN
jgi:predicted small lipoprotein YifL